MHYKGFLIYLLLYIFGAIFSGIVFLLEKNMTDLKTIFHSNSLFLTATRFLLFLFTTFTCRKRNRKNDKQNGREGQRQILSPPKQ